MIKLEDLFENAGPAPRAEQIPKTLTHFSDTRIDNYYWLRDKDSPKVLDLLQQENLYTSKVTESVKELENELFDEIKSRIKQTDLSVPVKKGNYSYFSRTEEGLQYPVHLRKHIATEELQILIDENLEAANSDFFSLGGLDISPDENLMVYLTDKDGSELYTLTIREIDQPTSVIAQLENCYYGTAWSLDSRVVFYTKTDDQMRPYQIWKFDLSSGKSSLVYQEDDESFYIGVGTTKDEKFVVIECGSKTTNQSLLIDAANPEAEPIAFSRRVKDLEYSIEHHQNRFFIVTNRDNPNFSLMTVAEDVNNNELWEPYLEYEKDVRLLGLEIFRNYLALLERHDAVTRLRIVDLRSKAIYEVPKDELVSTIYFGANEEFDAEILRFEYTSMVIPRSILEIDMNTRESTLLKKSEVLGNFDQSRYSTFRIWADSHDGIKIPVSVVCRSDLTPNSSGHPTLLYGYGSYEHSIDPTFSSIRLSLLDRGIVFAIAHVRGGGELGRSWYLNGKLAKKTNTFHDFISARDALVNLGWSDSNKIAARGGSAGGMLMGAIANMAPSKFKAIVAEVPFVDCLTTILDPSLPLTVFEWEEWGNPLESNEIYQVMKSYSPYDNISTKQYPFILATAGLNDPRVSYWEPAKWVQKLRALTTNPRIVLKTELGAGHQGPSGRYDVWKDEAFVYAFLLRALEID